MEHLKGASIRTLAQRYGKTLGATQRQLKTELNELPSNETVTAKYCGRNRWCGVLLVDAKYIKVKGYDKKIALIYGIDYFTHDIPLCLLVKTETFIAYKQFFTKLKNINYKLRGIVSDEHEAIPQALEEVFGERVKQQLCHVHILENIRKNLRVRTEDKYVKFVDDLKERVFMKKRTQKKKIKKALYELFEKYKKDDTAVRCLISLWHKTDKLTNHLKIGQCPKTNNLIESYNSQLEGRLKTIQGFESFHSAKKWLNAWLLARRVTPFTGCRDSFRHLNGKCSFEQTKKSCCDFPDFF